MEQNANATQVGGTHYRTTWQHWDFVIKLKLGYFEGQITKYVTRHAKKNGLQDVEKALHYAKKAREAAINGYLQPAHAWPTQAILDDFTAANELGKLEANVVRLVCTWNSPADMGWIIIALKELAQTAYPPEDGGPTGAYVDQGRDI
jgi:hypothetical protein